MEKEMIKQRVQRLRQEITTIFDTIVVLSDANRRYLSGYTGEDGNYDETAGLLIITQQDLILATDSRYDTQARDEASLYRVHCWEKNLVEELPKLLKSVGARRVGIEESRLTCSLYQKLCKEIRKNGDLEMEFTPADDLLGSFRTNKDPGELIRIREVLSLAENAFLKFRPQIRAGMTEREAAWLLEKTMREMGADGLSFPVIAASGPNSALAHATPGARQFQKGEPLLFDFGARLKGYCSDTTRTLVMGEPDSQFKEIYDILFQAQRLAIEAIAPGVPANSIDKIARDYIDDTPYRGKFGHSLGHGVGLAIHEEPRVSRLSNSALESGMVITVEPGIYIPQWGGIRLENMVVVTENGAEVLNSMNYGDFRL